MRLSHSEREILLSMSQGQLLKSHRDLDGTKAFRLHKPDGQFRHVDADDVHRLRAAGLIDSNKKFPVATFWLSGTDR